MQVVEESGLTRRRRAVQARARRGAAARSDSRCSTPLASLGPAVRPRSLLHDALAARHAPRRRARQAVLRAATSRRTTSTPPSPRAPTRKRSPPRSCSSGCRRARCDLPPRTRGYDADGIVAYSKICTHAGCAISLYRAPLFQPDRAEAGARLPVPLLDVRPGRPAARSSSARPGRKLPMLPLRVDAERLPARARATSTGRSARRGGASG